MAGVVMPEKEGASLAAETKQILAECDWLGNLSNDPYFRGLQDQVQTAHRKVDDGGCVERATLLSCFSVLRQLSSSFKWEWHKESYA